MNVLFTFFLLSLIFTISMVVMADDLSAVPGPKLGAVAEGPLYSPNATEFIHTSCETTLYPELCYQSLASYANYVQQDPARLALIAVGMSLSRTKALAIYVANLSREVEYASDPRAASAVHDCFTVFRDAVDQIRGSLNQMRRLTGVAEELRFQISNVQTWMSAALTDEDTCTEGFQDVADGPMKVDICDRTARVMEVISNALALVNSFEAKVT